MSRSNVSVNKFAKTAGISQSTLWRILEDETYSPTLNTVRALEKAAGEKYLGKVGISEIDVLDVKTKKSLGSVAVPITDERLKAYQVRDRIVVVAPEKKIKDGSRVLASRENHADLFTVVGNSLVCSQGVRFDKDNYDILGVAKMSIEDLSSD